MSGQYVRFLSLENILNIHDNTIQYEGGGQGIRDMRLLESAVAMPQAMFGGEYLHKGLAEMGAAYLFHICQKHGFIDGNKRMAAFATVLFLDLNGVPENRLPLEPDLERVTLLVASGGMTKAEVVQWLPKLEVE